MQQTTRRFLGCEDVLSGYPACLEQGAEAGGQARLLLFWQERGAKMHVFVVDDNEDITEFLTCLLSGLGLRVHAFNHPLEALAYLKLHQLMPLLLITDYNLPSINGVELHRQIRLHTPALHTIVISGRNAQADVAGLPFLQKPFQPEQMIAWVTSITSSGHVAE